MEGILKEEGGLRVRLVPDESPEEPYDDGAWPILRIDGSSVTHWNAENGRPHVFDDAVEDAVRRWGAVPSGEGWAVIEKWLRAFLGATRIVTWNSGSYWYVAYDSAEWREWAGVTPKGLAKEDPLAEIKAWVEGDCWGWVIEKKVTRVLAGTEQEKQFARTFQLPEETEAWEEVESCYGYYGDSYARERALEEFDQAAGRG